MKREFWAGRRVLVTGHTGFKGSWAALLLGETGARVTGYALDPPSTPSLFETARVAQGIESVKGDIADVPALEAIVRRANPDVVLHMAAQSLVRASYDDPMETYRVNVMGTVSVLEALRRVPGNRTVIVVTTDKCYENREWVWGYRETDALGGRDPYSNSKACAELASAAYRSSFFPPAEHAKHGVAMATARAGNVIGGGDWGKDRVVPDIVTALREGKAAKIRNPDAYRPWQHVLDALHGYLVLAERLTAAPAEFAEAWNFGPSEENVLPVRALADDICRLWGGGARWEHDAGPRPHEATRLMLDSSKSRMRLSLPRNLDYATALSWTAEWYRKLHDGGDARELTLAQIRKYLSEVAR